MSSRTGCCEPSSMGLWQLDRLWYRKSEVFYRSWIDKRGCVYVREEMVRWPKLSWSLRCLAVGYFTGFS